MDLSHVILTRFNLATAGREQRLRSDPHWLSDRFALFERYCLPSVAAQTDRAFTWLVLFDDQTPAEYRARIDGAREVFPFRAVFTPTIPTGGKWSAFTRVAIGPVRAGRLVVTSNLDNDDAIAADYVARVKEAVAAAPCAAPYVVNFENGLVLGPDGARYVHRHRSNAFACLVEEDTPELRTIKPFNHMDLQRHFPIVQERGAPAWLQVVHGRNVSNRVRGRLSPGAGDGRFAGVLGPEPVITRGRALRENWFARPLGRLRDFAVGALRSIVPD